MDVPVLELTSSSRRAFERLAADLQRVFGTRFVALVAYGTDTGLAFSDAIRADDLDALGTLVSAWHREGLATPLVMTPDEFRRSLDAFPIEFQAILDRHVVIAGQPPFAGVTVQPEDLRQACEIQARSFLIHVRQGWLQCAGHHADVEQLMVRSGPPFRALLSNVARLQGVTSATDEQLADVIHQGIGLPADLVRSLLETERLPEQAHRLVARMPELLAAAETLWNFVDAWRAK
jgi:hypothetical protein